MDKQRVKNALVVSPIVAVGTLGILHHVGAAFVLDKNCHQSKTAIECNVCSNELNTFLQDINEFGYSAFSLEKYHDKNVINVWGKFLLDGKDEERYGYLSYYVDEDFYNFADKYIKAMYYYGENDDLVDVRNMKKSVKDSYKAIKAHNLVLEKINELVQSGEPFYRMTYTPNKEGSTETLMKQELEVTFDWE